MPKWAQKVLIDLKPIDPKPTPNLMGLADDVVVVFGQSPGCRGKFDASADGGCARSGRGLVGRSFHRAFTKSVFVPILEPILPRSTARGIYPECYLLAIPGSLPSLFKQTLHVEGNNPATTTGQTKRARRERRTMAASSSLPTTIERLCSSSPPPPSG